MLRASQSSAIATTSRFPTGVILHVLGLGCNHPSTFVVGSIWSTIQILFSIVSLKILVECCLTLLPLKIITTSHSLKLKEFFHGMIGRMNYTQRRTAFIRSPRGLPRPWGSISTSTLRMNLQRDPDAQRDQVVHGVVGNRVH